MNSKKSDITVVDEPFYRSSISYNIGSPIGSVIPAFEGESAIDLATGDEYVSYNIDQSGDLTSSDWIRKGHDKNDSDYLTGQIVIGTSDKRGLNGKIILVDGNPSKNISGRPNESIRSFIQGDVAGGNLRNTQLFTELDAGTESGTIATALQGIYSTLKMSGGNGYTNTNDAIRAIVSDIQIGAGSNFTYSDSITGFNSIFQILDAGTNININRIALYHTPPCEPRDATVGELISYLVEDDFNTTTGVAIRTGLTVDDLTRAAVNRALNLKVSEGVDKYNIYAGGTANNYFGGNVQIEGSKSLYVNNKDVISDKTILVKSVSDFGTIDSSMIYLIDGIIDMGTTSIEVPATGINIKGHDFNVSQLVSSEDNYTLFTSPVGGSGDVIILNIAVEVTGASSKIYDLTDATGNHAIEIENFNYNNCSSLGELNGYRQGLELNTGRFGGTPELTLSGTWAGGFAIQTSIIRGLVDGSYYLFKEGTSFTMASRFVSNQNIDLNTTVGFSDFQASNFLNTNTFQLTECIFSRNGVFNVSDTTIVPNLNEANEKVLYRNNTGLINSAPGGKIRITTEVTTVVSVQNDYYDLLGTFDATGLDHFDSPANGQLRNIGTNPVEFPVHLNMVLNSTQNNDVELRIAKFKSSTSTFEYYDGVVRTVNNLAGGGGRDVAIIPLADYIILEKNDYIKIQVRNLSGPNDITGEVGGYCLVGKI